MTKEKFNAYLQVRDSGITNMFDVKKVVELSDGELNQEDCFDIMKNFRTYVEEYKNKKA